VPIKDGGVFCTCGDDAVSCNDEMPENVKNLD